MLGSSNMSQNLYNRLKAIRDAQSIVGASKSSAASGSGVYYSPQTLPQTFPQSLPQSLPQDQAWQWVSCGNCVWRRSFVVDLPQLKGQAATALSASGQVPGIYFDTETTGLSGGAGTVAFLMGWLVRLGPSSATVVQYFLSDYPGESVFVAAIIDELQGLFASVKDCSLVSYNGASFDLPLLKMRSAMHGLEFPAIKHRDALHPARSLWRSIYQNCSLSRLEHCLFAINRINDPGGAAVPALYSQWLSLNQNTGFEQHLGGVFEHHVQDLVSLVLIDELSQSILSSQPQLESLGATRSSLQAQLPWLPSKTEQQSSTSQLPQTNYVDYDPWAWFKRQNLEVQKKWVFALWRQNANNRWALVASRLLETTQALAILSQQHQKSLETCLAVRIALLLEHRLKDYTGALELVNQQLSLIASQASKHDPYQSDLNKRAKRLLIKIGRACRSVP